MSIREKLMCIQTKIKVPKNLYNSFGNYKYRNAEGICEAAKPLLEIQNCCLVLSDEIVNVGDRYYLKATATLIDTETKEEVSATAYARESMSKKGMDDSQITGSASSYARKYALNGLFLLDDTKDADTEENRREREKRQEKEQIETPETISKTQATALYKVLVKAGVDALEVCAEYKVSKLSELSPQQYVEVLNKYKGNGGA